MIINEDYKDPIRQQNEEMEKLKIIIVKLRTRLSGGRDYLMSTPAEQINAADCLGAFGFDNLGYDKLV